MDSVSPVWTEEEVPAEVVCALDQPEYYPIIILPINYTDGIRGAAVRFRLSEVERKAITEGADILITEMTFGGPFTPIAINVLAPGERPA